MRSSADYHVKRFCETPQKKHFPLPKCYDLRPNDSVEPQWIWIPVHFDPSYLQFYNLHNFSLFLGVCSAVQKRSKAAQHSGSLHNLPVMRVEAVACGQSQVSTCSCFNSTTYCPCAGPWGLSICPLSTDIGEVVLL